MFEIIKKKISAGYDSELRRINYPVNNFRDYVIIGIRVKELDWVKEFIRVYSYVLPEKHRTAEKILLSQEFFRQKAITKMLLICSKG